MAGKDLFHLACGGGSVGLGEQLLTPLPKKVSQLNSQLKLGSACDEVSSGAAKEGGGIAADGKIGAASADLRRANARAEFSCFRLSCQSGWSVLLASFRTFWGGGFGVKWCKEVCGLQCLQSVFLLSVRPLFRSFCPCGQWAVQ